MGIKFRGKTSVGDPVGGSIKERELEVNLVDKHIFTSSNGTDIINLTERSTLFLGDYSSKASLIVAHASPVSGSNAYVTVGGIVHNFIWDGNNWLDTYGSGIPDETNHKGESLSTEGGITGDTAWTPTLTTPSKLYADLLIPDDGDVNHILAGIFDTNGFTLDVPASTTVTIV